METLIQGGKYQVIEVLTVEAGYTACLCIDVETNNQYKPMIFNIYEKDEDIRRLLPVFFDLSQKQYTGLMKVMPGKHSITAVFDYHQGERFCEFFKNIDKEDFEKRCKYTTLLLEECLILDTAPDFIASECLEADRIVVSEKKQKIEINYIIKPKAVTETGYKGRKLAVLLNGIFVKNRYVPDGIWDYIEALDSNSYDSIVAAFACWKEINGQLLKEHTALRKEALMAYILRKLKRFFVKKK